jgi:hypothetical protein
MNTKIIKPIIVISITTALTLMSIIPVLNNEARAYHRHGHSHGHCGGGGSGGAFIGGMIVGHVVSGAVQRDKEQTAAMNEMAYGQPRNTTVYVQQPATTQSDYAPAGQQSAEERINQLDKLAANGYITPAEYKAKKQAIINGL